MSDEFELKPATERAEGAWEPVPDNSLLNAVVLNAAKTLMPFKDKVTGEDVYKVKWSFQVTQDGPFRGRKVEGLTSTSFVNHPECRMYQWAKSLLGADLPEGFVFKTDDVIGIECVVLVSATEKERRDGNGVWVNNNVVDVRPAENIPVSVGSAYGISADEEPF